ncbi:MAG: DUF2975 domain-containing protein [Clostridiales bacterium]|nr:DUF2975 domain-containing protein [Clostridiales bacterium]
METTKMMKTASAVDVFLKILQGFMIAGFAVCLIFIPLVAILGEKMVASASSLDLGALRIELAGGNAEYLSESGFKLNMIGMLGVVAVIVAIGWYFLRVLRQILAPMKQGRPFESGVSDKIKKLGWVALIGGFVTAFGGSVASILELKCYDLNAIFTSPAISGIGFNYSFGLGFAILALVLFFLSFIFRSGEALQRESDETL